MSDPPSTPVVVPAPGWYQDPEAPRAHRYWNGSEWGAPSPEDRQAALAGRIAYWVRNDYRVEAQSPEQAVMVTGHRPNHILHLILTILTLGIWLIVWIILAIAGGEKRKTIAVDAYGRAIES